MAPHQERVIEEKQVLDTKLRKLTAFLDSDKCDDLPVEEWCSMKEQLFFMTGYSRVLGERIERFPIINAALATVGTGDSTRFES